MTQDGVYGHGRGFQQNGLGVADVRGNTEELVFVQQHLFAPAATDGLRTRESATFTQSIVAGSA
jgi:hypothetical protein